MTDQITNFYHNKFQTPARTNWIKKYNPHNGKILSLVQNSNKEDILRVLDIAQEGFFMWSKFTSVQRGQYLFDVVDIMNDKKDMLAKCVAQESGKSYQDAMGEVQGAIMQGRFFAGEGMRLYGKTINSAMPGRSSSTKREPLGIAALIVPSNTPIANIAWKLFPALICGNSVILKASEDTPKIANLIAKIFVQAKVPKGIFSILHGDANVGKFLVKNKNISLISFTGSTSAGKWIAAQAGRRLARVSLELGGKNALVVCDDANIDHAVKWAILSAFSNAGQRCAAASRIILFTSIQEEFCKKFIEAARQLKLGTGQDSDLGPVINKKSQLRILEYIKEAKKQGLKILLGGGKPRDANLKNGFYIEPTIIMNPPFHSKINQHEIFGPVTCIFSVDNIDEAIILANKSDYGLTSSIHTTSVEKSLKYTNKIRAGLVNVNLGTHGSEPQMPFGGFGISGNGTREPGIEALNVYSELKNISFFSPDQF
ncbi:aldehyde dehydrogenase family protein [Gammaproteobacteria bacterium]|nr:aldehyde dehydrogenase family protein [Gammaproteobacteria bacterium]MDA9175255.1 aldehyde dehydrogenase family protein [Gammaproteobacteria bacterium]MDA9834603.1 aldehyde dehydrogenase family protein [Gammaproteobacteria bacterium]MDA9979394.1 aldehyde dehydrogenase family protein [Gammaproteobacteria bacterium]MDC3371981.1 aldehyde dehydrogenase family protein [Gammaproteobacteria bacterium]